MLNDAGCIVPKYQIGTLLRERESGQVVKVVGWHPYYYDFAIVQDVVPGGTLAGRERFVDERDLYTTNGFMLAVPTITGDWVPFRGEHRVYWLEDEAMTQAQIALTTGEVPAIVIQNSQTGEVVFTLTGPEE